MNNEFIKLMLIREASISVGPSTARGMGPAGMIKAAREFLQHISLEAFGEATTESRFQALLGKKTRAFMEKMPLGAKHWGSCRKFLNIFLRGATYNRHLCRRYKLARIERWLELPLDSHVAKGLRGEPGGKQLPRWQTVKGLSQEQSRRLQQFAYRVAKSKGVKRIDLDIYYWRRVAVD